MSITSIFKKTFTSPPPLLEVLTTYISAYEKGIKIPSHLEGYIFNKNPFREVPVNNKYSQSFKKHSDNSAPKNNENGFTAYYPKTGNRAATLHRFIWNDDRELQRSLKQDSPNEKAFYDWIRETILDKKERLANGCMELKSSSERIKEVEQETFSLLNQLKNTFESPDRIADLKTLLISEEWFPLTNKKPSPRNVKATIQTISPESPLAESSKITPNMIKKLDSFMFWQNFDKVLKVKYPKPEDLKNLILKNAKKGGLYNKATFKQLKDSEILSEDEIDTLRQEGKKRALIFENSYIPDAGSSAKSLEEQFKNLKHRLDVQNEEKSPPEPIEQQERPTPNLSP